MNKIKQSILAIVIGLVLSAGVSYAEGIWKNPEENPPNKNTDAPINVGRENQTKAGGVFFTNPIEGGIRVNGAANFSGLSQFNNTATFYNVKIPNDKGVGKVLTSDADGNASWEDGISKHSFFQDWTELKKQVDTVVYHNLGTDRVMIYLEGKSDNGVIHQVSLEDTVGGARWKRLTSSSVTVLRSSNDNCSKVACWKYFRITIWKINQ